MTLSPETLTAYIDGELPPEETHRVEGEIAGQPELKAYVEQQRALARAMHDSFDEVLRAPVPEALTRAVSQPASWRWRLLSRSESAPVRRVAFWSGLPAAAAAGLLIGMMMGGRGDIATIGGALVARGTLAQALTNQLASEPERTARATIGITFRDSSGHYCRTFQTSSSLAGVACRESGSWRIAAVAKSSPELGGVGNYRTAGSAMPAPVRSAVMAMISGSPLDAAGERKAKDADWTPQ